MKEEEILNETKNVTKDLLMIIPKKELVSEGF
jgi:hypothetical protein